MAQDDKVLVDVSIVVTEVSSLSVAREDKATWLAAKLCDVIDGMPDGSIIVIKVSKLSVAREDEVLADGSINVEKK